MDRCDLALSKLIYASEENQVFSKQDLLTLRGLAQEFNTNHGITGYLCYEKGTFFQYLEGSPDTIAKLMEKIGKDPRHKIVNLHVFHSLLGQRLFPNWHMKFFIENSEDSELKETMKSLLSPEYSPENMERVLSKQLLELSKTSSNGLLKANSF